MTFSKFELIKDSHLRFAKQRGDDKTYCPSEVARELFSADWRIEMDNVRKVAEFLIRNDQLIVLQKGENPNQIATEISGPIRFKKK